LKHAIDKTYFYKKYSRNGKAIQEYLCKDEDKMKKFKAINDQANQRRMRSKEELRRVRATINSVKKQIKIVNKVLADVGT